MKTFKHWDQEQWDEDRTIKEFIREIWVLMQNEGTLNALAIVNTIKEKHPDNKIPNDITLEDLQRLLDLLGIAQFGQTAWRPQGDSLR